MQFWTTTTLLFASLVLMLGWLAYHLRDGISRARMELLAQREFFTHLSHEIRTPMTGVLGMSELLRDSELNTEQRHYNDVIYDSAKALLKIIDDLLDFSKLRAGRMQIESIAFNLHNLADDALALFRHQANKKRLLLRCDITANVAQYVIGDPTRIRQILLNFLSNAIKFTTSGSVLLQLRMAGDYVRLVVTDTGTGIPLETQRHLFESFRQAGAAIARQYGGSGLGLVICKQLTELMDGRIGVYSKPGSGSTFWVELPLQATALHNETLVYDDQPTHNDKNEMAQ